MSNGGAWIPDTIAEAKGEWGVKSAIAVGIWIVGPITGEISLDSLGVTGVLFFLTFATVCFNVIYQDWIRPRSPAVNLNNYSQKEARSTEEDDAEGEEDEEGVEVETESTSFSSAE